MKKNYYATDFSKHLKCFRVKKLLLTLSLIFGLMQITKAQTACADFVAGSYTITQENSFYGPGDVYHFKCLDDILLDLSCSIGASSYHMRVAEFDLNTWTWTKDFCGGWESGPVPSIINVSKYFPANEPTCGKVYAVGFVEGPTWNPADVLFFKIDCNDIPLDETYTCKENILYSDYTETFDKAYDQLLLNDGTRVITGTTYVNNNNHMRLFIKELDPSGNTIRKHSYPIQGDDVSNVQIIYDKQTDEYVLFFDTQISSNRDVYFVRIDRSTITTFIQYYGPLINDNPGGFSNEFAVKIEDDLNDKYMLVVNQHIPAEKKSYVVMIDKNLSYAYCPSYIQINNSKQVVSHDIIETGGRINDLGCADKTSYLLVGSLDNNAFVVGLNCNGVIQPNANIFDVDGNTATIDPAKRIQYYNGDFYIGGEVNSSFLTSGTVVNGKIWLSSFTFNNAFQGNLSWLKIYDKNTSKKESLVDMDYADGQLYLTGQTEIEQGPVLFPTTVGPKAYFFSTDLSGNPIWSKEYFENPDTESRLCDIELHCGAIYGIGSCSDQILTSDPLNPIGEIEAQNIDIYRNKTNLLGELSGDSCYNEIFFEPIEVQPPVDLVATQPFGECIDRPPLDDYEEEELVCEVDCCESETTTWVNDCPIDVLFVLDNSGSIQTSEFNSMVTNINQVVADIDGKYTNAQYAITHYYGGCGNLFIEQDFAPTVSSISRQGNGNDDLNNALGLVIDAFNSTSNINILPASTFLNQRTGSDLYILIFTDAWHNNSCGSAMLPYTNLVTLKNASFNANITLIHYSPNAIVNPVAAAITSTGGIYTGLVDPAYTGQDGLTTPRQYIPWNFSSSDSIDICSIIPPCTPCVDCDSLMVRSNIIPPDSLCCYSIDLKNNTGANIPVIEAEIISPDWGFATGSWQTGSGFNWCSTSPPNSQKLCLESSGISPGWTNDALRYCLAPKVSNPSPTQQIVFTWKVANGLGFEEVCKDTISVNCDIEPDDPCLDILPQSVDCNPDNPYEYFFNFKVKNNSSNSYSFVNFSNASNGELFQTCVGGSPTNSLSIPTNPLPLNGMTTGNSQCVKIISATPVLSPTQVCFDAGIFDVDKCCNRVEPICITLEPCCDPCEDNGIDYQFINVPGEEQCCVQVDLINECAYKYFTKIEANILTPGISFGYHALGGPDAANWSMCGSTSTSLCIKPNSGTIDNNFIDDILQFCIDDIDNPSEVPQEIIFNWYTQITGNNEVIACTDTLILDCPEVDNRCIEITDDTLECTDVPGVYNYTFTVTNVSTIPFCATDMDLFITGTSDLVFTSNNSIVETIPFVTSGGLCTSNSETITTTFTDNDGLPTTGPLLLQYRMRYAMGDTCCYESEIREIDIPICCENENGDFSDYDVPYPGGNAGINSNLSNWFVSHGTPTFSTSGENMWMWSYNNRGEGVYTNYNFVTGNTYQLEVDVLMQATSNPNSVFNIELTTGLPVGTGNTAIPTPASQPIASEVWNFTSTWQTLIYTFTVGGVGFNELWFYPYLAGTPQPDQAAIRIDNICVTEMDNPCPPIIIKNDVPILEGIYHAGQKVESAGTVPPTGNVDFKAGQNISLENGFEVQAGATFNANIEPCCCSDDPLNDLAWLQAFVGDPNYAIRRGIYQNQCVFIVTDFCIFSDGVTAYYDCQGNLICTLTFGGTTCPANFTIQNSTVLQGC